MKWILALGNPGDRYRDTRHNVGWWLADRLVGVWRLPALVRDARTGRTAWTGGIVAGEAVEIHKPLTYMNRSGEALRALGAGHEIDPVADLLVLVDDAWLPPGRIRLRRRGSAGGHNGLASIEEALESDAYPRLRIGIGRPDDEGVDLADWVLARVPRAEEEAMLATFPRAVEAVECWMRDGIVAAMNRFNQS
ncbi:MAG: aminoacyl-tRNA hydrolase [Gemmatimonadota bacterium]